MPFRSLNLLVESSTYVYRVEVNLADGTYELHSMQDEEPAIDLHQVEAEPMQDQVSEDPLTFPKPKGKPPMHDSLF